MVPVLALVSGTAWPPPTSFANTGNPNGTWSGEPKPMPMGMPVHIEVWGSPTGLSAVRRPRRCKALARARRAYHPRRCGLCYHERVFDTRTGLNNHASQQHGYYYSLKGDCFIPPWGKRCPPSRPSADRHVPSRSGPMHPGADMALVCPRRPIDPSPARDWLPLPSTASRTVGCRDCMAATYTPRFRCGSGVRRPVHSSTSGRPEPGAYPSLREFHPADGFDRPFTA